MKYWEAIVYIQDDYESLEEDAFTKVDVEEDLMSSLDIKKVVAKEISEKEFGEKIK